jgi:hypothetical protein
MQLHGGSFQMENLASQGIIFRQFFPKPELFGE